MAKVESHFSISIGLAIAYSLLGVIFLAIKPEIVFLAAVLVVITGILPNIDEGGETASNFSGLIAAAAPLLLMQLYPNMQTAGVSRMALTVIGSYFISKYIFDNVILNMTSHRGVMHSIPAAIITFEVIFLLFHDLSMQPRLYLACGGFTGFFSHLMIDGYTNLDLMNRALGKGVTKKPSALKLTAETSTTTLVTYSTLVILGWFVVKDLYPNFKIFAGVHY